MATGAAQGEDGTFVVQIDKKKAVCENFLGFGAEWDPRGYNAAGVTEADFGIVRKRVEWMRLPVARIMMQCKWCYKGDGKYDWDDAQMASLFRNLDVCEKLGTRVLLSDWGIEPTWLKTPDVAKVEDPKYAEIIGTYMDHLLNKKKYRCGSIRFNKNMVARKGSARKKQPNLSILRIGFDIKKSRRNSLD